MAWLSAPTKGRPSISRLGRLKRVDVVLGKDKIGGPFAVDNPPPELNWDLWQGQTPDVPYIHERCHYTFRWWYAYSGGQLCRPAFPS